MRGLAISQDDLVNTIRGSTKPLTPTELAEIFECHWYTAFRKLEGAVHQGILIKDTYGPEGEALTQPYHRYILDPM